MIVAKINDHWLWRAEDGREAWIMFEPDGRVCICTDIYDEGQPKNAVHFTPDVLRKIADEADRRRLVAGETTESGS